MKKTALVFGATGVSGRALLTYLEGLPDWDVIAVARKPPAFPTRARFILADLLKADDCIRAFKDVHDVTHVFYTAYQDNPVFAETRAPNNLMFVNAFNAITPVSPGLRHFCLLQGTKYYGQYLGPFKTPAKETDPRISVPHFYYDQQDFITGKQRGQSWSWSCARPHVICGLAIGNPLNIVSTLAVYASLAKELGRPLTFPGKAGAFSSIYQATDATLLARAMLWMSTTPGCANEAFNITNGDFFRYQNLWPAFATFFGLENGGVKTCDLNTEMAGKDEIWKQMILKYGLADHPLSALANWNFANYALSNDWDVMSDTTKCRKFGFLEFLDSEEMFLGHFGRLRQEKIIP
jgi:nucleoside-diphosphate-sugar epimerase